ncbi:MAG: Rieske (2Fe-2S) protein [Gemmatimonadetes bacterium]|nr:Rieske (2Fe-2S) protein [Gemmatimonadota bacterium]
MTLDRRSFVAACGSIVAGISTTGCAAALATPVTISAGQVRVRIRDLPVLAQDGRPATLQPDGLADPIIVTRVSATEFVAVSPICTHRGCTAEATGERIVCPCHGSTYTPDGRVVRGPAERALTRYPVALRGDELTIMLTPMGAR